MENLDQMFKTQLFINDFALHDSSRDLVLASTQQNAEIKLLLDQEAKKKERLEESMKRLDAERKRADMLLYQLLPRSVAEKLRAGVDALSTCESFDNVSILFTDIVGFTTICSGITPMAVVKMLNNMYSLFDRFTEEHGVFKVETIGDAYMVVGGAPNRTKYHGELTCDCAMSFVKAVEEMQEETSGKKIRIRAGIHSGPVVAGVVGVKMPRYCLFGETVLIANQMESTGQALKIQVSATTKKSVEDVVEGGVFKFTNYAYFDLPNKNGKLKTFWLDEKKGPARDPTEVEYML